MGLTTGVGRTLLPRTMCWVGEIIILDLSEMRRPSGATLSTRSYDLGRAPERSHELRRLLPLDAPKLALFCHALVSFVDVLYPIPAIIVF
jgi:hypothetical protein